MSRSRQAPCFDKKTNFPDLDLLVLKQNLEILCATPGMSWEEFDGGWSHGFKCRRQLAIDPPTTVNAVAWVIGLTVLLFLPVWFFVSFVDF